MDPCIGGGLDLNPLIEDAVTLHFKMNECKYYSSRLADINQAAQEEKNILVYQFRLHLSIKKLEKIYPLVLDKSYLDELFEYLKN